MTQQEQPKEEQSPLMRAFARRDAMMNYTKDDIARLEETSRALDVKFDDQLPPLFEGNDEIDSSNISSPVEEKSTSSANPKHHLAGKKQGGRKPTYDVDKFVEVFTEVCNSGGNPADVASRMEMTPDQVAQRATQLRKKGYDIPQFKRGRKAG